MNRLALSLLLGSALIGARSATLPVASQGLVSGTYDLVTVGGRSPTYHAQRGRCDVPIFSRYQFTEHRWVQLDTVRAVSRSCCEGSLPESWLVVNRDSGYFRVTKDTLNLWVDNTMIGLQGWIDRAFVKGDTLVFLSGEFDPGDYVYVRKPARP